jgi:hypothetical protein
MLRPNAAVLGVIALVLLSAMAGCGAPKQLEARTPVEEALARTPGKVLHGRVVSDEIQPIPAALVELLDGDGNLTTAEDGSFLFAGLEARDYLVRATSPGYYPEVQRAAMMLGRDFELDFRLAKMPTGNPRHETQVFEGFIACHATLTLDFPGPLRFDCGAGDPNDARSHVFTFDPHSSGFVLELDWQPTVPCANSIDFGLYLLMPGNPAHALDERTAAPGERIHIPPSYFAPRGREGGEVLARIGSERCEGIGGPGLSVGLAFQQPIDVYFTAFYLQEVPDDFSVRG